MPSVRSIVPTNPTVTSAMFRLKRTVLLDVATWVPSVKCQTHLALKHQSQVMVWCETQDETSEEDLKCPKVFLFFGGVMPQS